MIEDEVIQCLRELVDLVGATSARIVAEDTAISRRDAPVRTIPMGAGESLLLELSTRKANMDVDAAVDQAMRKLRTIRRRWEVARLPEAGVLSNRPPVATALGRIEDYLKALATIDRGRNVLLVRRSELIAAARIPDDSETTRWPQLADRVQSNRSPYSSHGELVDPDAFAMSFWYDAALLVLLAEPYAVDFVRHRCRQVARELCHLLPLLEPDPDAPAAMGPRSPTQGDA